MPSSRTLKGVSHRVAGLISNRIQPRHNGEAATGLSRDYCRCSYYWDWPCKRLDTRADSYLDLACGLKLIP